MLRQLYRSLSLLSWSGAPFRLGGAKIPCRWSCWSGVCNLLCTTETKGHLYTRQPPFLTVAVEHIILAAGQRHLIPAFIPTFVPAEPLVSILLLTHETLIAHLFSKSCIIRTIVVLCQTDALSDIDFALLTIQNGHIPHVRGTVPSPAIDAFRLKKQLVSL